MRQIRIAVLPLVATIIIATACAGPGSRPSPLPSPTASAASSSAQADAQSIALTEWRVAVPTTIKAGQVSFSIINNGTIPHELLVFRSDLDPSAYPTDTAGTINEEGAGISLISDGDNLDPGGSQPRSVDLTTPGKYLFVCNIPGHFTAGMFTVVTVTP